MDITSIALVAGAFVAGKLILDNRSTGSVETQTKTELLKYDEIKEETINHLGNTMEDLVDVSCYFNDASIVNPRFSESGNMVSGKISTYGKLVFVNKYEDGAIKIKNPKLTMPDKLPVKGENGNFDNVVSSTGCSLMFVYPNGKEDEYKDFTVPKNGKKELKILFEIDTAVNPDIVQGTSTDYYKFYFGCVFSLYKGNSSVDMSCNSTLNAEFGLPDLSYSGSYTMQFVDIDNSMPAGEWVYDVKCNLEIRNETNSVLEFTDMKLSLPEKMVAQGMVINPDTPYYGQWGLAKGSSAKFNNNATTSTVQPGNSVKIPLTIHLVKTSGNSPFGYGLSVEFTFPVYFEYTINNERQVDTIFINCPAKK